MHDQAAVPAGTLGALRRELVVYSACHQDRGAFLCLQADAALQAVGVMNDELRQAVEALKHEATVLALLHIRRHGGTFKLAASDVADLDGLGLSVETPVEGVRLYREVRP